MKSWPANNKTASFEEIIGPICAAIRFAYSIRRRNRDRDVPYDGFEIGENEQGNSPTAQRQLKAENLAYSEEDQNRDALEEIVALAVRLGIEQGRRIAMNDTEYRTLQTLAATGRLLMDRALEATRGYRVMTTQGLSSEAYDPRQGEVEIGTFETLEDAKQEAKQLQGKIPLAIIMPDNSYYDWTQDPDWMAAAQKI